MSDALERLEARVGALAHELAAIRRDLAELRGTRATATAPEPASRIDAFNTALESQSRPSQRAEAPFDGPPSAAGTARARPPARNWAEVFASLGVDASGGGQASATAKPRQRLEDLIGRYGTLALAAITILMGVGAFVGWAIRNGMIGPELRVALGILVAIGLAALGWRMRQKGDSPRFGNVLLALALAVIHVVAWGAGPRLHLVSDTAVLAFAALGSVGLAALAWREDDQALYNVGFGGALLAPFVTSSQSGDPVLLLIYGAMVLGAGIVSLRQRQWTKAPLITSVGVVVYTIAALSLVEEEPRWAVANAPAMFAIALSVWATLLLDGAKRMAITYLSLLAALGALMQVANGPSNERVHWPLAVALIGATYFAGSPERQGFRTALAGSLVLPLGALAVALGSLGAVTPLSGTVTTLCFAALAAGAAWLNRDGERGTHAFTATLMVGIAIAFATDGERLPFSLAIAGFGIGCAWLTQRLRLPGIGVAGVLWLVVGTTIAFMMLWDREWYAYRPLLTEASLAAAAVSVSWILLSWHTSRQLPDGSVFANELPRSMIRILGAIVAFAWLREELAHAWSADIGRFLVTAYYAVCGVAAIFVGRRLAIPLLRHLGLGLCVFAALSAIVESSRLAIGWKVGSYIVAGFFLLLVAYWYRATRFVPSPAVPDQAPKV